MNLPVIPCNAFDLSGHVSDWIAIHLKRGRDNPENNAYKAELKSRVRVRRAAAGSHPNFDLGIVKATPAEMQALQELSGRIARAFTLDENRPNFEDPGGSIPPVQPQPAARRYSPDMPLDDDNVGPDGFDPDWNWKGTGTNRIP